MAAMTGQRGGGDLCLVWHLRRCKDAVNGLHVVCISFAVIVQNGASFSWEELALLPATAVMAIRSAVFLPAAHSKLMKGLGRRAIAPFCRTRSHGRSRCCQVLSLSLAKVVVGFDVGAPRGDRCGWLGGPNKRRDDECRVAHASSARVAS